MTKKIFVLLLSIMFANLSVGSTYADTSKPNPQPQVNFQAAEIKDRETLKYRMDHSITDDVHLKIAASAEGEIYTDGNGQKYTIKSTSIKCTSQKLKEAVYPDGTIKTDFVANSEVTYGIVPMMNHGSGYEDDMEAQTTGTLYQTTYYEYYTDVPLYTMPSILGNTYKFTSTVAQLVRGDSTFALKSLVIKQTGTGPYYDVGTGSGYHNGTKTDTKTVTGPSSGTCYTLYPTNTNYWWWIKSGYVFGGAIRGYSTGTITRGTSTYKLNTEVYFV